MDPRPTPSAPPLETTAPGPDPDVRPDGPPSGEPAHAGRYELRGEIGRGGMGAVLAGRDPELDRPLAVKVLLPECAGDAGLERRFLAEAQICGRLQHPGVVPVYDVGRLADGRPFFTMKLVKGRTLAELLAARPTPSDDLARFVGVFEQVCQAVAYAHSRGVLHRDLKPSNVMVGEFGEVQVMDWGLAKVLMGGPPPESGPASPPRSTIYTVRTSGDDLSRDGTVLGTPAYMAPEQARGDVDMLDARADVFGLGAVLCEILTGRPPFAGPTPEETRRRSARCDVAEAFARLAACGADAELVRLAKACLDPKPERRPADAAAVASVFARRHEDRMFWLERRPAAAAAEAVAEAEAAHRRSVEERLRAEVARVEERERANDLRERQRRRRERALAAAGLALAALLAAGGWSLWQWQQPTPPTTGVKADRRIKPDDPAAHFNLGLALSAQGKHAEAEKEYRESIRLQPDFAMAHNQLAWLLATCPDPRFRYPGEAVRLANRAVELDPQSGPSWNTLGAAHCRAGDWKDAIEALEKSMQLRKGGDSFDWFFLAMAHWKLGEKDKAREWYDKAVDWMDKNKPQDEELKRFRAEAAALLGVTEDAKDNDAGPPKPKPPG
jgi:tetratricopeptide (TPR) repeat protein